MKVVYRERKRNRTVTNNLFVMEKIKEKLIHLLGGVTEIEKELSISAAYRKSKRDTLADCLSVMERRYGMSADDWCKEIYEYTKEMYDKAKTNYENILAIL